MKTNRRLALLAVLAIAFVACSGEATVSQGTSASAEATAAMVMKAWASGDAADIEAVYASDVRMILDTQTLASDRDEITGVITEAIGIGNTYEQVGPVAEYVASGGDTYIATVVKVTGIAHQTGVPVVGFYRVRDGKVIRHVFMDAEHY